MALNTRLRLNYNGVHCGLSHSSSSGAQFFSEEEFAEMKSKLGAVYTPSLLADWVAQELVSRLPQKNPVWVLDPACGDGALLLSVLRTIMPGPDKVSLAGIDIDSNAIRKAASQLPPATMLKHADALLPEANRGVEIGWKKLVQTEKICAVISNPPWGAELRQKPKELRAAGYKLARGQFDSYDIFIELCLRVVPQGAILAFIVPDSLFFPEHKPLRALLLEQTQLQLIARLGEGLFGNVYRGTAIIICRKAKPTTRSAIECFRLRKALREQVLNGRISLKAAKQKEVHIVPQEHFHLDPEKRFLIDVSGDDMTFFQKMNAFRSNWVEWLKSGRGVELSKSGAIVVCPICSTARPEPKAGNTLKCQKCERVFRLDDARRRRIIKISQTVPFGWKRLIVGEDVNRYRCASSRIIKTNVPGINYKTPESFEGAKLLVRKTGVGLKAAIDDSGALTNQVVFHYKPLPKSPAFILDYVLGVLCSRVMLAYYLKRTGENEWRSHPYMTQKTIAELPVPAVSEGQWEWRQAKAIADAVSKRRRNGSDDSSLDLYIDSLVAGLYGLNKRGCTWVLHVLNEAQPLQPIAGMRADAGQLRPVRA
jgi:predicted RNA methylase